ncbi:hypothetical protein RI367_004774 [Sorochytrium milnesiophthora]
MATSSAVDTTTLPPPSLPLPPIDQHESQATSIAAILGISSAGATTTTSTADAITAVPPPFTNQPPEQPTTAATAAAAAADTDPANQLAKKKKKKPKKPAKEAAEVPPAATNGTSQDTRKRKKSGLAAPADGKKPKTLHGVDVDVAPKSSDAKLSLFNRISPSQFAPPADFPGALAVLSDRIDIEFNVIAQRLATHMDLMAYVYEHQLDGLRRTVHTLVDALIAHGVPLPNDIKTMEEDAAPTVDGAGDTTHTILSFASLRAPTATLDATVQSLATTTTTTTTNTATMPVDPPQHMDIDQPTQFGATSIHPLYDDYGNAPARDDLKPIFPTPTFAPTRHRASSNASAQSHLSHRLNSSSQYSSTTPNVRHRTTSSTTSHSARQHQPDLYPLPDTSPGVPFASQHTLKTPIYMTPKLPDTALPSSRFPTTNNNSNGNNFSSHSPHTYAHMQSSPSTYKPLLPQPTASPTNNTLPPINLALSAPFETRLPTSHLPPPRTAGFSSADNATSATNAQQSPSLNTLASYALSSQLYQHRQPPQQQPNHHAMSPPPLLPPISAFDDHSASASSSTFNTSDPYPPQVYADSNVPPRIPPHQQHLYHRPQSRG